MRRLVLRATLVATLTAVAACGPDAPAAATSTSTRVTIDVFSDPQCQPCRNFYLGTLEPLLQELGSDRLQVVHHLYPLPFHKHAREAARLVLAGDRLAVGGRERVLGALFRTQATWAQDGEIVRALAGEFSPDELSTLTSTAALPDTAAALDREIATGRSREIRGTPTIFVSVNGQQQLVPSTVQYEILRRYLMSLLET